MQKRLEFVISSKFLVVHLQQIVPLNKVYCFWPYFHFVRNTKLWPRTVLCLGQCIFKVLTIPSMEKNVYRVISLLPTDLATLASEDGDSYR